jgi:hypothetical protein
LRDAIVDSGWAIRIDARTLNFSRADPEDFRLLPDRLARTVEVVGELLARGDVELLEDVAEVGLHGREADDQCSGNLSIGEAFSGEVGNPALGAR